MRLVIKIEFKVSSEQFNTCWDALCDAYYFYKQMYASKMEREKKEDDIIIYYYVTYTQTGLAAIRVHWTFKNKLGCCLYR
jgi:hypothetical protein